MRTHLQRRDASRVLPHFILVALDRIGCAPALVDAWGLRQHPASLSFSVAVRETEAWLDRSDRQ